MAVQINELHICTFKTPTSWAVMSEQGDADCAFKMRNGVKILIFIGFNLGGNLWFPSVPISPFYYSTLHTYYLFLS